MRRTKNTQLDGREIAPDVLLGEENVAKFINTVMRSGKKTKAQAIVYKALDLLIQKLIKSQKTSEKAVRFLKPVLEADKASASGKPSVHESSAFREVAANAFGEVLNNAIPKLEVISRRMGGATIQVPAAPRKKRQLALAMRWLVRFSAKRSEHNMEAKLAGEFYDAFHGTGATIRQRETVHKMADASRTNVT